MTLEKTLRLIVIGGVFLLPFVCLLVTTSLFFPYITGKNFAFRIIVEIMTGAWLALALVHTKYRPRRSWILGALAVFVAIIALADLLGPNPFKSIWSNYERMDGLVTLVHLLAYTVVAASVLHTEQLWRRLFQVSLGVSACVAVYGFLQLAGISALGQGGAAGLSARVDATFGNPIYMAVYLLFHIFIAAHLWMQSFVERERGARVPISIAYGALIALYTIVLFFTGTRGTIIGLVGGAFLSALILALLGKGSQMLRRLSIGAGVAILLFVAVFMLVRDQAWVKQVGFLDRLATISTSDNTVKARFINWSIAWQGVKERPVLGWGQENYAIVFDKYYDPRMYAQEPWFDRVHNIIFDWLVAGGLLGLVSYLTIFVATLAALWRGRAFSLAERALFTGLLAAYFCHNFFVFDNVTSYILFGTVLAYIVFRSTHGQPAVVERRFVPSGALPFVAIGAAVLVWIVCWWINADALAANRTLLKAISVQPDPATNLVFFKKTIAYESLGTQEAREQLVQAAASVAGASLATSTKQDFFDTASREMLQQALDVPLDARFPLFLGMVHDAYGDYESGAIAFEQALRLSPKKPSILFELARNALIRNEGTKALGYYRAAFDLAPEYIEARILYAAGAIRTGDLALADRLLAPIIESGSAADPRIVASYAAVSAIERAIPLWEAKIVVSPQDMQAYFTLAAIYFESGSAAKAVDTLQRAKRVNPAIAEQADPLIKEIQSGTATF
ncbi:MAG TPA: O-antigen ligase family protein [Candidatus Paceibacterota bacterium]